jgi:CRISPR-associated endonuclease/helicase Cas3
MSELSSFELISHPDRTLREHLGACNAISERILLGKYVTDSFFSLPDIDQWRKLLVYFHDFGKATDFFQAKIIDATEQEKIEKFYEAQLPYIQYFKQTKKSAASELMRLDDTLDRHAELGAYWLFTQFSNPDSIVEYVLLRVIRRHHGHLSNFDALKGSNKPQLALSEEVAERMNKQVGHYNFDGYNSILTEHGWQVKADEWSALRDRFKRHRIIEKAKQNLKGQKTLRYFFLQHYLFSLLLSADKGDMMLRMEPGRYDVLKPNRIVPVSILADFRSRSFGTSTPKPIDVLREEAFQRITANVNLIPDRNFYSITLPTGFGKTLAAYQTAFLLQSHYKQQTGTIPHIIYCLPFTSVIDQNAQILQEIFGSQAEDETEVKTDWINVHHYLSAFNEKYDDTELTDSEGEYLAEGWEQEVIVTTFVQLLESLFTNRNRSLRKFHNMTNAVVILDEVQAIPAKYYRAVEAAFRAMATYFGTRFVLVTATQPILFADEVVELTDPRPERTETKRYFTAFPRITLDQSLLKANAYQAMEFADIQEIMQADIDEHPEKSFLLICNTIVYSQDLFRFIKRNNPDTQVIYLSSSILPRRRRQLIKLIRRNIKREIRQIIVSTQVVEAGVDIDLDVVYRDWSPMDSINQSAGRCNRNGVRGKGIVKLFHSGKAGRIYHSVQLGKTQEVLEEYSEQIDESEFYQINQSYAKKMRTAVAEPSEDSDLLIEAMQELRLEDVADLFELIEDDQQAYNVFIPYSKLAEKVWRKYQKTWRIEDTFERKRAIKKLTPQLLPYVTRFPKNKYCPAEKDKDKFIIYERNWHNDYDLESGFRNVANQLAFI